MKKLIGFILVTFILNSCDKTAEDKATQKIVHLEKKLATLEQEKNKLDSAIAAIDIQLENQTKTFAEDYVSKAYVKNIVTINLEKLSKIDHLKYFFNLSKENTILRSLTNNWKAYLIGTTEAKLLGVKNRNPKEIAAFFNDDMLTSIIRLLKENKTYQKSKSAIYIQSLLNAYESFEAHDYALLDQLYNLSVPNYSDKEAAINDLLNKLKKDTEDIYKTKFPEYKTDMTGHFNVYSFWARRHHEGNMKVVHAVMKKIHTTITE